MADWFAADFHFGHASIIDICHRPFPNVNEMDAALLCALQNTVQRDDSLWIIGDFAIASGLGGARNRIRDIFERIHGRKHLILGNHDIRWVRDLGWASVENYCEIKVEGRRISLSHYPMATFAGARHGAVQLFGHVHDNWAGSRNSINVGVDQWGYRPVNLPENGGAKLVHGSGGMKRLRAA